MSVYVCVCVCEREREGDREREREAETGRGEGILINSVPGCLHFAASPSKTRPLCTAPLQRQVQGAL